MAPADNLLFYGDNLDVLRRHIGDESVDLVYLDPPFNSDRDYNVRGDIPRGRRGVPGRPRPPQSPEAPSSLPRHAEKSGLAET
jgi:hypothetical protein